MFRTNSENVIRRANWRRRFLVVDPCPRIVIEAAAPSDPQAGGAKDVGGVVKVGSDAGTNASPKKALAKFLAGFGDSASMRGRMGQSPPCRSFRLLRSLEELAEYRNQINQAMTKDDLALIAAAMKPFKGALQDLITMTKAANVRLKKSIADVEAKETKAAETAKHASADQSKKRRVAAKGSASFWDTAASLGTDVPAFRCVDNKPVEGMDMTKPSIIRLEPGAKVFEQGSKLAMASGSLMEKYRVDPARNEPGRAQKKLGLEAAAELGGLCGAVFPEEARFKPVPSAIEEGISPIAFAVTKGRETCASEAGFLGSVRVGVKGTRTIVFAQVLHVSKFLDSTAIPLQKVYHQFKTFSSEGMAAYLKTPGAVIYHGTAGCFDAVYCPPGWMFAERISHNEDFFGFRHVMLLKDCLPNMSLLNEHLLILGKPSEPLQAAVDAMNLVED